MAEPPRKKARRLVRNAAISEEEVAQPSSSDLRRPFSIAFSASQKDQASACTSEMVSIIFEDDGPAVRYPKEVLQLSSVLRDALESPRPRETSGGNATIKLSDSSVVGGLLLDVLSGYIRPRTIGHADLLRKVDIASLARMADKYNVSGLLHKAYSLLIMQAVDQSRFIDIERSALMYAAHSGDPWLCHYVASRLDRQDPIHWEKEYIDGLGFEFWYALVQAYPRSDQKDQQRKWIETANKVSWEELCKK